MKRWKDDIGWLDDMVTWKNYSCQKLWYIAQIYLKVVKKIDEQRQKMPRCPLKANAADSSDLPSISCIGLSESFTHHVSSAY